MWIIKTSTRPAIRGHNNLRGLNNLLGLNNLWGLNNLYGATASTVCYGYKVSLTFTTRSLTQASTTEYCTLHYVVIVKAHVYHVVSSQLVSRARVAGLAARTTGHGGGSRDLVSVEWWSGRRHDEVARGLPLTPPH